MNKIGLLLLPAFLVSVFTCYAQAVDPSEAFLKAYMTAQQGEKLERENQFKPALAKYRFAGSLIEELKKDHGDWQPAIVEYRGRKVGEAILRVQSKMATQTDLAAATGSPGPEGQAPGGPGASETEPSVEIASAPSSAKPVDVQAAIENATRELRARVENLEAQLKRSQQDISSAQQEKVDLTGRLQATNTELEQAKGDLAKQSQTEKDLRDQLASAQESLRAIQSAGTTDQKAVAALRGEIARLKKALQAAEGARSAADKDREDANNKLLDARKQAATVTQERDKALRELKVANEAQSHVQVLVAENADLQKKLAAAENTVREISADRPRKAQELEAVKRELEKLRDQLVTSQKANQNSEKTIAQLRTQLDETSGQLASAKLNGATSEETERLVKENEMLRAIVVRERQEEARREQAKKLMLTEFDKLKIQSDVLDQQIHLLAEPITKLSPEELALLKTPVVSISDSAPGTVKASLTMAKPPNPVTINNAPAGSSLGQPNDKSPLDSRAQGESNSIDPEGGEKTRPGVPTDLLPLAREAKANFDQGKFKEAEKLYQQILAKDPNNLYSLSNLGVVLFRDGKLKASELTLKKTLAIAPRDEFTHTTLGIVYYQQSKFDDALSELTKALAINPKSATAHNYLGITASQKGWQEAAEKEMLEAIADNPDYADAYFNLAVVYSTSQPPAKELARRHYEKALALGAQPDPTLDKSLSLGVRQ